MVEKTIITVPELHGILDSVFEYNKRGQIVGLIFYDPSGQPIQVAYVETVCDGSGLAVRSRPEKSAQEEMADQLNRAALDPRLVPAPQSLQELEAVTKG